VKAVFLEEIIGSKTKVRILYTLFKKDKDSYFEKELAVACGSSVSEVNRQINSLVEFGLVFYYKEGRLKMYKLNPAHFLYKPLKELFTATG
jgi:DNA-binding transcriptional ArsR family regulator